MIAVACALILAAHGFGGPARESRTAFAHAMAHVEFGWTKEQVRKLLGRPDDVWPADDSYNYVAPGDEAWCYGTDGHHTMPTLGYVMFREGAAIDIVGGEGEPPSPGVIGEAELIRAMRRMYRRRNRETADLYDPQRLIETANLLMSKGREKALAVIGEYARVDPDVDKFKLWLLWLVRVMFDSKLPGGVFPVPGLGVVRPQPPDDLVKWPRYPVLIEDDVPFCPLYIELLGGSAEPFSSYLHEHQAEWTIRQVPLRPPDDPFPTYRKLIAGPAWPFARIAWTDMDVRLPYVEGEMLREVLALVRTAYRPKTAADVGTLRVGDYDRYHKEFLALQCRWDARKQAYVRKGGRVLRDEVKDFAQCRYRFGGLPSLDVTVWFRRANDSQVDYGVGCRERGKTKVPNAIVIAEDPRTGKELGWMPVNYPGDSFGHLTKDQVLGSPPHEPGEGAVSNQYGFALAQGKRVRFVIEFAGKRFVSPQYRP